MGFRAYARHRGCTLRAVQLAIESKRINTKWHKGQIKIDSELADRDWEANTNDAMARNQGPNYNTSRAVRETYQAKIARLDYEERCNKLVDAEMVKRESFEMGRQIRDSLENIPGRVSGALLGAKDIWEIEKILDKEIKETLEILSKRKSE